MTVGSLFAGIGGFDLVAQVAALTVQLEALQASHRVQPPDGGDGVVAAPCCISGCQYGELEARVTALTAAKDEAEEALGTYMHAYRSGVTECAALTVERERLTKENQELKKSHARLDS